MNVVAARSSWSEDSVQSLRTMAGQGMSAAEIANHFGTTKQAILTRISRDGMSRVLSWLQRDRILDLHLEGARVSRIAIQIGVSEDTIAMFLRSKGFDATSANVRQDTTIRVVRTGIRRDETPVDKRVSWSAEEIEKLKGYLEQGLSQLMIAAILERSVDSVKGAQRAYGLFRRDLYKPAADIRSAERETAIRELRGIGLSYLAIAKRLGIPRSQVARSLRGETKK